MKEEAVLFRREQNVGIITLNRPERLNAINPDLLKGLIHQLHVAREDENVVAVILGGAGKSFCAGEDLKETKAGKSPSQWEKEINALQEVQRVILQLGKPLIAAIRGYAVGGGLEFALSCDIRIAAQDAKFGFPETGLVEGVASGCGGRRFTEGLWYVVNLDDFIWHQDYQSLNKILQFSDITRPGLRL